MLTKSLRQLITTTIKSNTTLNLYTMSKLTFCELQQGKPSFPKYEEEIMMHWRKIDAFKKQLEKTKDNEPFTFYDGPPFATGKPRMLSAIDY